MHIHHTHPFVPCSHEPHARIRRVDPKRTFDAEDMDPWMRLSFREITHPQNSNSTRLAVGTLGPAIHAAAWLTWTLRALSLFLSLLHTRKHGSHANMDHACAHLPDHNSQISKSTKVVVGPLLTESPAFPMLTAIDPTLEDILRVMVTAAHHLARGKTRARVPVGNPGNSLKNMLKIPLNGPASRSCTGRDWHVTKFYILSFLQLVHLES